MAEVQLNHPEMIQAKQAAHKHYETIRSVVPQLCRGTAVDAHTLESVLVDKVRRRIERAAFSLIL